MKNYIEEVWLSEIETMDAIFDICQSLNLRCYLAYGTLIGAVRHNGFIPWDDDVDLVMPRPDYERFCKLATKYLPPHLRLNRYNLKNTPSGEIPSSTLKVENTDCEILRNFGNVEKWTTAWVDIWPLDGVPKGRFKFIIYKYNTLVRLCLCRLCDLEIKGANPEKNTPLERAIISINRLLKLGKIMNRNKRYESLENYLRKYNYNRQSRTVMIMGEERFDTTMPKSYYQKTALLNFNGKKYPAPSKYDLVLRKIFGNYMQLPPKEKRVCRHIVKVTKKER